jgi:SAM-dependent methyltransferase
VHNVKFEKGNVLDLNQFPDNSFDIVHEHQVLLHVPTPVQALKEMRRVVKPGGIISCRDNYRRDFSPVFEGVMTGQAIFAKVMEQTGAEPEFGLKSHIRAHEAGFAWDRIEPNCAAWEVSGQGEAKRTFAKVAETSLNAVAKKFNAATDEELKQHESGWIEFGKAPEARLVCVDGTLLCWK